MSSGIAVDANVMALFSQSTIRGQTSNVTLLVDKIKAGPKFAIDTGGKIQHQWLETCGPRRGQPFYEWFVQGLKDGYIRTVTAALGRHHLKYLEGKCGFPNDRFESTYIAVANVTEQRYVVTEDIHFYEPRHKYAGAATKTAAKLKRDGRVCRYLSKLNISVGTVDRALEELFVSNPQQIDATHGHH